MKSLLCLFALAALTLSAAEIPLDRGDKLVIPRGDTYLKWQVIRETATTITIRHSDGAATLKKSILPEPYRTAYPVNVDQADAEAAETAAAKAEWNRQIAANEQTNKAALAQARQRTAAQDAARARQARTKTTKVQSDTVMFTPRSATTVSSTVTIPGEVDRRDHVVEFLITGPAVSANVRYGKLGALTEENTVNPSQGWGDKMSARTGEQVSIYVQASNSGGQAMLIEMKVDGVVVKKQEIRGLAASSHFTWFVR